MEDNEVLDFESELEAFEKEWQDEETVETEPEAGQEAEEVEQEEQPAEEQSNPNDPDAEKRNAAFAQLRRQAEENRKYAEFIQRLAEEGGVTPDDLLSRYEERKLQDEAKTIDPAKVLKESRETKTELTQLKEQLRADRFNAQVEAVSSKYGAAEEDIRAAMQEMMESGIDPRTNDNFNFEKFYRAANLDKIIQQETEKAVQKNLEDKRKRQENASIGNGNSVSPPNTSDWSDEDFDAELKRLDIRL